MNRPKWFPIAWYNAELKPHATCTFDSSVGIHTAVGEHKTTVNGEVKTFYDLGHVLFCACGRHRWFPL